MALLKTFGATPSDTASAPSPKKKPGFSAGHRLTPSELSLMDAEAEVAFDELDRLAAERKAAKTASKK